MLERIIEKTTIADAFIIFIAAFATVSFWRGIWGLMDLYLYPKDYKTSLIISVIIGLAVLFSIGFYKKRRKK
jgi:hypothetical protein